MIKYTEEKTFTQDQVQELFKSVGWISAEYPQRLHKSTYELTDCSYRMGWWVSALSDLQKECWMIQSWWHLYTMFLCILNIRGRKIAGNMVEYIRDKYKNYLYIEGMQEDSKNVAFYERHGFHVMEGGTPIQICNFSDKR